MENDHGFVKKAVEDLIEITSKVRR